MHVKYIAFFDFSLAYLWSAHVQFFRVRLFFSYLAAMIDGVCRSKLEENWLFCTCAKASHLEGKFPLEFSQKTFIFWISRLHIVQVKCALCRRLPISLFQNARKVHSPKMSNLKMKCTCAQGASMCMKHQENSSSPEKFRNRYSLLS